MGSWQLGRYQGHKYRQRGNTETVDTLRHHPVTLVFVLCNTRQGVTETNHVIQWTDIT